MRRLAGLLAALLLSVNIIGTPALVHAISDPAASVDASSQPYKEAHRSSDSGDTELVKTSPEWLTWLLSVFLLLAVVSLTLALTHKLEK